jgi:hypothetical protein
MGEVVQRAGWLFFFPLAALNAKGKETVCHFIGILKERAFPHLRLGGLVRMSLFRDPKMWNVASLCRNFARDKPHGSPTVRHASVLHCCALEIVLLVKWIAKGEKARQEKSLDRPTMRTLPTSGSAPVQTAPWHEVVVSREVREPRLGNAACQEP